MASLVTGYSIIHPIGKEHTKFDLVLQGRNTTPPNPVVSLIISTINEARYLIDILRNEYPVFYNMQTGAISTGTENVGEGE